MGDCLIVVGMHRSGTSALAGAIHRLGAVVGSDVVEAQHDNVRGYYEHRGILELHECLLAACGSAWDDISPRAWQPDCAEPAVKDFQRDLEALLGSEFADAPLWVVKDPRLCHLFPLWLPVLARLDVEPRVLFAHRPAAEVAASLARRNGFSPAKSNLLWADHVLAAERATRGSRRSVIDFDDLLREPGKVLERAARQLRVDWPHDHEDSADALASFLDPSLRRRPPNSEGSSQGVVPALEAALAAAGENPLDEATFDAIAADRQDLGTPIELVVEHLHQFSRRETATTSWKSEQSLSAELAAASTRLGAGFASVERSLSELEESNSELAGELAAQSDLAEARRREADRALAHLTEASTNNETAIRYQLETAARHQEGELADLRSRLDRLQYEVEVEARLEALRVDLDYLAGRVLELAEAHRELAAKRRWWRRALSRLGFRRPAADA